MGRYRAEAFPTRGTRGATLDPPTPFPATILAIHNRYRLFGGEDTVFDAETALLEARGHRVERLVVDNREIQDEAGLGARVRLAAETVCSSRSARRVSQVAGALRPDVVHVHNFFPLLSPSIYGASRRDGAAVVQTLHNYRLVCPGALLMRDSVPCETCLGRTFPLAAIRHTRSLPNETPYLPPKVCLRQLLRSRNFCGDGIVFRL